MLKRHICSSFHGEREIKVIVDVIVKRGDSVPRVDTHRMFLEGGKIQK